MIVVIAWSSYRDEMNYYTACRLCLAHEKHSSSTSSIIGVIMTIVIIIIYTEAESHAPAQGPTPVSPAFLSSQRWSGWFGWWQPALWVSGDLQPRWGPLAQAALAKGPLSWVIGAAIPAGGCFGRGVWLAEFDLLGPSRKRLGTCPMKLSDTNTVLTLNLSASAACKRARRVNGGGVRRRKVAFDNLVHARVLV